jgi:CBS-domain-containing membrane protein
MQKGVIWGSANESVQQALTKMQQADVGYMMVGTEGQLDGIVSKSDITGAVSVYLRPVFAKWRRPIDDATLQIKIKWIMTRPVRTIKPDTSFAEIIENMCQFGMRCLPVIDSQGKVVGSVTVFNIFKLLSSSSDVSSAGKTPQVPQLVQLDL